MCPDFPSKLRRGWKLVNTEHKRYQRANSSLSMGFRINIHSHTVYYTSEITKKFSVGKIFLAVFREWPEMWESCLLLMFSFFTHFWLLWGSISPELSRDCHPPWLFLPLLQQNLFVVLSNQIQRPCYDWPSRTFQGGYISYFPGFRGTKNNWVKIWKAKLLYLPAL